MTAAGSPHPVCLTSDILSADLLEPASSAATDVSAALQAKLGNSEAFFHGLTLGFLAVLRNRYKVKSNRESGDGRFDIALTPLVKDFPGVIIEVKAAKSETDDLKALAQEARDQIDQKNYAAEMTAAGIADILKLGLAYHKKNVELVSA